MRKACIELNSTMKYVALNAGSLGGGRFLVMVTVSNNLDKVAPAKNEQKL